MEEYVIILGSWRIVYSGNKVSKNVNLESIYLEIVNNDDIYTMLSSFSEFVKQKINSL